VPFRFVHNEPPVGLDKLDLESASQLGSCPTIKFQQPLQGWVGFVGVTIQYIPASRHDVSKPNLALQEQADRLLVGGI